MKNTVQQTIFKFQTSKLKAYFGVTNHNFSTWKFYENVRNSIFFFILANK